jgi:hypothetical protein
VNAAILDDETSKLLETGVAEYPDIAKQERAVHRAQSRTEGALNVDALHEIYEKARDLEALREAARSSFAEKLGWNAGALFSLDELRMGAASGLVEEVVVGHSRRAWADCRGFGMIQGLQVDALPGSWISPGVYIAVLYTRQGYVPTRP